MNFSTKYLTILTQFVLLFCVVFFLVYAISSCNKYEHDISLVADSVTLSFDVNGGTPPPSQRIKNGKKAIMPTNPTKGNSIFRGWFTNNSFTTSFCFCNSVTKDMVVYAKWTSITTDFSSVVLAGKIPMDIKTSTDTLSKYVFAYYPPGATITVRYITPNGKGDGSSWSQAHSNLKTVLESITDASKDKIYLILLATGEYKAGAIIAMKKNIAIVGGFVANNDADYTQSTTDTTALSGGNSYGVFNNHGLDSSSLFYGLKITAGKTGYGGGMYNDNSTPVLTHVTFTGNNATYGGGIFNNSSSPILTHVICVGNTTTYGGGIYNNSSSPILSYVTFARNTATYGGGIYNVNSTPVLTHVTFTGNSVTYGGGISNNSSSPILTHVTFDKNRAKNFGGGMYNYNSSLPILKHVLIADNTADYGGGMYNSVSSPILTHVTFDGNTANYDGGGMYNISASLPTLTYVTFVGNRTTNYGGGMYNINSSPVLTHMTFSGNTAASGGGIYNKNSSFILNRVTFASNTATYGGGMSNMNSSSLLNLVVITGNTANYGGGMYNISSTILITSSILWGNIVNGSTNNAQISAGKIALYNSILEGGQDGTGGIVITAYKDMVDTDPSLATLMNNGGFVQTMLIPSNSSARNIGLYAKRSGNNVYFSKDNTSWFTIDVSTGASTPAALPIDAIDLSNTDARGYKITDQPDAGAYEYGATAP